MKTNLLKAIIPGLVSLLIATTSLQAQNVSKKDSLLTLQKNAISMITPGQGTSKGDNRIGLWGYVFGDYAYMGKGDSAGRGTKQQYKGLGAAGQNQNPNAFELRRAYLGVDFKINKKFSASGLLAYEGDQNLNFNRSFYMKYFYVRWKSIWKGTDLKVGQQATNSFATAYNTEPLIGYRAVEKTIMDMHGMDGSSDMGVMLEGKIWTGHAADTGKVPCFIGYSAMIGDNSGNNPVAGFTGTIANSNLSGATVTSTSTSTSTSTTTGGGTTTTTTTTTTKSAIAVNPLNTTTDVAKKFRGNLYVNALNTALTVGVYADYINYGSFYGGTGTKAYQHAVNTEKAYASYNSKWFGIAAEFVMQSYTNGEFEYVASTGKSDTVAANQMGFSVSAHGTIIPNTLNIFARYDMYTPDTKYKNTAGNKYTDIFSNVASGANANSYKETFITAGLDWTPTKDKKVHVMPNIWYYGVKNGYGSDKLASDSYMLYRLSFLFAFN